MPEMEAMTRDVVAEQFAKLGGSLESSGAAEPSGDTGGDVEAAAPAETEQASTGTVRDDKGRFTKGSKEPAAPVRAETLKTDADAGQGPADGAPSPALSAAPVLPELKPPQDWRAAAKDEFAKAPRAVQEEALRTYAETRKTLDRAAALEKEAGAWKEPLAPYEHFFRARGMTTQQGVGNLVQTYAALHTAPMPIRAKIVSQLVREHLGTDETAIRLLAAELDGNGAGQQAAPPPALSQEQIRQLARQEWEAAQREQGSATAVKAWQEFEPSAKLLNEEGVRADTAELVGKWSRENPGQIPSKEVFQKAYDRACLMNEGAAKIVNQRKEAEAAGKANASTQARTAAAIGIKNEPAVAGSTSEPADTVQEEVRRQYARLSNKRR